MLALIAGLVGLLVGAFLMRLHYRDLRHTFAALSSEALRSNSESFLELAQLKVDTWQQAIRPVQSTLDKFEGKLGELERSRLAGQTSLKEQMNALLATQRNLQQETTKLATSLRSTSVRGRWGEIQLRRVVELAGMVRQCDFFEQPTAGTGRRPDMVVRLPGGRQIVIDAKVPLDAYLKSAEASDEEQRARLLKRHADQVRQQIRLLASKEYAAGFEGAAEFVVLFLPGEIYFSAALAGDATLIEWGAERGVVLATPTTLIALLRAVSFGWRQEQVGENARQISVLGRELHRRLGVLTSHLSKMGRSLRQTVGAYNDLIGSLERRVLPKAREFETLGVANAELESPPVLEEGVVQTESTS